MNIKSEVKDKSSEIIYTLKSGSQKLTNVWLTLSLNTLLEKPDDKLKAISVLESGYENTKNNRKIFHAPAIQIK